MTLSLAHDHAAAVLRDDDVELFRYVFVPDTPQFESPKPYLDPIRTRAGRVVSLFRPWDHVWHKGIAWSLPVIDADGASENFWGGPTYVSGEGYVQLPNDGAQVHRRIVEAGAARFVHELDWITEAGRLLFTERRTLGARVLDESAWALTFETVMTNVSGGAVRFGSPTTKGRDNAGYGGLFWRGPRSFTEGALVTAAGTGSGVEVRGQRHDWMGFVGRHDEIDASSVVVMVDASDNPHHPPQWFARSEEFACLNPAPFFSEELEVGAGEAVRFRYAVGIADAGAEGAPGLATRLRELL